ncbi:MAG: putative signal transduction protein [Burkholderiaceae bacterium]|nr:putative signal transduction protein [Burkholderiaceae bacterium]
MENVPISAPRKSTLDFLLRRMQHKTDFPALSEAVSAINKMASSEKESVVQLSNSILKDFSLTNKILRLVNTAYYRQATGGNISTVSRAVLVLGFDAVRNIAITLMLFEHLQNKANAHHLKEEFLRTNLAGILGRDISAHTGICDTEQAFICSMFCNLGRLLCNYYFPEESEAIKQRVIQKSRTEDEAMVDVLGISYEDLGIEIARFWGFPNIIINSMRKLPAGSIRKPMNAEERLQVLAGFANEFCYVIASATPEQRQNEVRKLIARFEKSLPIAEQELQQTLRKSVESMKQFASIINLDLQHSALGRKIRSWFDKQAGHDDEDGHPMAVLSGSTLESSLEAELSGRDAEAILAAGIQDISNTLVEDYKLNDVLRIILETMYRAKGFRRVILCIRDLKQNMMVGRFGFGPDGMEIAKRFNFSLSDDHSVFHAALTKGADILISDAHGAKVEEYIPEWFMKQIAAETFVLFPLCIKGSPVAMIYADRERAGDILIPEKELSLLRTLRNQAVLAIKQSA